MSDNSLFSTALWQPILRKQIDEILEDCRQREEAVKEFMSDNPEVPREDLYIECRWPFGPRRKYTVRVKTTDEKWLEWQSNNHGWEKSSEESY